MNGTLAILGLLAVALVPHAVRAQDVAASQRPPCEISQDAGYGYTPEQAIQVGGSPLYGASRQRRYLDALRGPEGQVVTYKRTGQHRAPDQTILDAYVLTYEGLEKPITLYLDWYHSNPPKAPRGFTCAQPFDLGAPPLDPFRESDQLQKVAVEQGATRELPPIPLSPDGSTKYGVMFDQFRILAHAARAAASQGAPLNAAKLPREAVQTGMLVIAYPLECDGRKIAARSLTIADTTGKPVTTRAVPAERAAKVLPGVTIPEGAVVTEIQLQRPRNGDTYTVTYAEAACGNSQDVMAFRSTFAPAKGIEMPPALLPEGADPGPPMLLQVVVDTDGKIQVPDYIGGTPALVEVAKASLAGWRVEPARANGGPLATGVLLQVQFTSKK